MMKTPPGYPGGVVFICYIWTAGGRLFQSTDVSTKQYFSVYGPGWYPVQIQGS